MIEWEKIERIEDLNALLKGLVAAIDGMALNHMGDMEFIKNNPTMRLLNTEIEKGRKRLHETKALDKWAEAMVDHIMYEN